MGNRFIHLYTLLEREKMTRKVSFEILVLLDNFAVLFGDKILILGGIQWQNVSICLKN